MRDLLLFALCCGLAAAFWVSRDRDAEESRAQRQSELYGLGAPQTMVESPERWLLLGEFVKGLRAHPKPETYRRLASLFLVSVDLEGREVKAMAQNTEGMARVLGKSLQTFDAQGREAAPRLWRLGDTLAPYGKPFPEVSAQPSLEARGDWLLYTDKQRWAALRWDGDTLRGYLSQAEISVTDDSLSVGEKRWTWSELNRVKEG